MKAKWLMGLLLALFSAIAVADQIETLIGGQEARPGDFPEVIYISAGSARCSATVVGPQTILTAAHCVADGGVIQPVSFLVGSQVFQATCKQSPLYHDRVVVDLALCRTNQQIPAPYATVASRGPKVGDQITLSGYGCIRNGGGGGNDGKLRYGQAPVTALPTADYLWFDTEGSSALCFGDSGGPAFAKLAAPSQEKHLLLGVNSRGDISRLSMLMAVFVQKSQDFLKAYAASEQVEICGVNRECGFDPQPPAPPKPPRKECHYQARKLDYYKRKVIKWQALYDKCQAAGTSEGTETEELPYFP